MKRRKAILVVLVFFVLLSSAAVVTAQAEPAVVSVSPSNVEASQGDTFTIEVMVDPKGEEIYAVQYDLYFNPNMLNATSQTRGTFLSQDGTNTIEVINEINNSISKVTYGETRTGESGISNSGVVASISFEVIAASGKSNLKLSNVKLYNIKGEKIETEISSGTCSIGNVTGEPTVVTAENQSVEYAVINAALSPVGGEFAHLIPSGSVIYHSMDGITTVYTPDGKRILKAMDSDAALVPAGFGSVPATKVHYVPNGSRFTIAPDKFYTGDRGWIAGNTTRTYAPDGTLVLTVIHEKRIVREETFATENQSEEYVVITAPITPVEGESTNHVPRGSLIYRSYDGITTVYAPDGKIILKARDISSKTLPISGLMEVPWRNVTASHGPKWATHVSGPIGVPNCTYTYESFKFYTEDRGWIIGNATKCYGPDGTLLLIKASKKRTICEKTVEIQKLGDSEFSGFLERTEDHVNTLDEFTAYWDCPSAPPSPNPNVGVLLFNAVQDYTDWGKILQPVICWTTENGHWIAYSMWGPNEPGGDYYPTSPIIDVDVGDKLKGEIKWDDTASCWHICIYNLDKGTNTCLECPPVGDNAELDIFTVLEAPAPYHVSDYTDLPSDTTFYDMSFKSQGSPVDIEWVKNVNSTVKGLIPELGIIVYSDSKVKLLTRAPVAISKSDHRYNNAYRPCSHPSGWCYGGSAKLDASESYDRNGYITEYKWDFGDGEIGYGEQVEHKYKTYNWVGSSSGHYEPFDVSLTVRDNEGNTNSPDHIDVNVYFAGDANGDGEVNIIDAVWVGKHWRTECNTSVECGYVGMCGMTNRQTEQT